ncbi:MORC family CW-type zinc finger protein 3-like isoform X2 [Physella acuta]|uniref:MORC family CW-type zinc finger protein 3-like isoform X2 n=1 Tax=Physella acuta TaxID=109671 RepID=UPI0027DC1D8E|nr:MORC family CW-type zinc finger protein 3-like isoform X2 [Physella acuta]
MASDQLTVNGISLSMIHPKYLHSNSTSHPWALGAMAELIDNAYDPDVGAKKLQIDKMERDGQLCLTFQDDGNGMDFKKLHQLLSFGFCDKTISGRTYSHKPIGQYGNGFKSGTMRLGKDVIVFTRCEKSASVGFLSQTYLQGIKAESVLVPLLEYQVPTLKPVPRSGRNLNLEAILEYSLYKSEEDLVAELTKLKAGTKIVIFNLKKLNRRYELDFDYDPSDIRCPLTYVKESDTNEERPVVVSSGYRRSLKEYYSILYHRPSSTNMEVFIRGRLVKLKLMSKTLKEKEKIFYTPKSEGKQIRISIGFAPEDDTEDYGMLLYHKNRLIKAYERIGCQKQANEKGKGVILVAVVDFLTPTHTKQDFIMDAKYNFVGVLAKKVNDFWKKRRENSDPVKAPRTPSKRPAGSAKAADNSHVLLEATSVHHDRGSPVEMLEPLRESADITIIKTELNESETREYPDDTIIISDDDDEDSRDTLPPEALQTTTVEPGPSVANNTNIPIEDLSTEQVAEQFALNIDTSPSESLSGQALEVSTANPTNTPSENLSGQDLGVSTANPTNTPSVSLRGQALEVPIANPTNIPSENLSGQDLGVSTANPTNIPSENLSGQALGVFIANPTNIPSENLSGQDLGVPTANLANTPSESLSGQALGVPTENPTNTPSENVSGQDLGVSTANPTNIPSENLRGQALGVPTENPTDTLSDHVSERSIELHPASSSNTPTENLNVSPSELRRSSRTQKKRQRSADSEENDIGAKTSEDETPMAKKRSVNTRKPMRSKKALRIKIVKKSKTPNLKAHKSKAATITAKHIRLRSRRAAKNYRPNRNLSATQQATPPAEKNDAEVQTDETTSSKTTPFHYKVFRFLRCFHQPELPANVCIDDVENFICEQNEKFMTTNSSLN